MCQFYSSYSVKSLLGWCPPSLIPHSPLPAGILPPHSDSHNLVGGYRKEQYQDILEALEVMRYINAATPSTHVYLRMFQLESQVLPRCSETTAPVRGRISRVILSAARATAVDVW